MKISKSSGAFAIPVVKPSPPQARSLSGNTFLRCPGSQHVLPWLFLSPAGCLDWQDCIINLSPKYLLLFILLLPLSYPNLNSVAMEPPHGGDFFRCFSEIMSLGLCPLPDVPHRPCSTSASPGVAACPHHCGWSLAVGCVRGACRGTGLTLSPHGMSHQVPSTHPPSPGACGPRMKTCWT